MHIAMKVGLRWLVRYFWGLLGCVVSLGMYIFLHLWMLAENYIKMGIETRSSWFVLTYHWCLKILQVLFHRTNPCPDSGNWVKGMKEKQTFNSSFRKISSTVFKTGTTKIIFSLMVPLSLLPIYQWYLIEPILVLIQEIGWKFCREIKLIWKIPSTGFEPIPMAILFTGPRGV